MSVNQTGKVAIGNITATANLDVAGSLRFRSLIKGSLANPVLTVDAVGNTSVVNNPDADASNEAQTMSMSKSENVVNWTLSTTPGTGSGGGSGSFSTADKFTFLSSMTFLAYAVPMTSTGHEVDLCSGGHVPTDAKMVQVYWGAYTGYTTGQCSRTILIRGGSIPADASQAAARTLDVMVAGHWAGAFEYKCTLIPMTPDHKVRIYPTQPEAGTSCAPPNCVGATTATLAIIGYVR